MSIGSKLFEARKASGLTQEDVAQRLGVSRQTISKWELDETVPDIYQAKKMSSLYNLTLDELIEFDMELKEIEKIIEKSDEEKESKIDWTSVWGKKYPILLAYQNIVDVVEVKKEIKKSLNALQMKYGFNDLETMLVFKDILGKTWNK